jgi:alkyl hydroperoxide reductase subunit F
MEIYDTIIIGGGPAAAAAAVYCGRKRLNTLLITESFGGQSLVSSLIENWIGEKEITGADLAKKLEGHIKAQEVVEIKTLEKAIKIEEENSVFKVETDKGGFYQGKTLVVATGGGRRKLNIEGESKFEGKGVFYCSICDAPLMKEKSAVVIGGGNAGLEAVIDLLPYAEEIYLLNLTTELKGDLVTQAEIKKSPKVTIINQAEIQEIKGDNFVSGVLYKDLKIREIKELKVNGVFVEIGSVPNSEFIKGVVDLNEKGEILIDHRTGATSKPGIFAAGDVTDEAYKQNNIAAGDGVRAALSVYDYLLKLNK